MTRWMKRVACGATLAASTVLSATTAAATPVALSACLIAGGATPCPGAGPTALTATAGGPLLIDVGLQDVFAMRALDVKGIWYDPLALTLDSITQGTFFDSCNRPGDCDHLFLTKTYADPSGLDYVSIFTGYYTEDRVNAAGNSGVVATLAFTVNPLFLGSTNIFFRAPTGSGSGVILENAEDDPDFPVVDFGTPSRVIDAALRVDAADTAVPEPATLSLLALGLGAIAGRQRFARRQQR